MKKLNGLIISTAIVLSGCAAIPPGAGNVMVHQQYSTLLDGCAKLGNVTGTAGKLGQWSPDTAASKATLNLRAQAFTQYGADSVAVLSRYESLTEVAVEGIAYKCY